MVCLVHLVSLVYSVIVGFNQIHETDQSNQPILARHATYMGMSRVPGAQGTGPAVCGDACPALLFRYAVVKEQMDAKRRADSVIFLRHRHDAPEPR